MPGTVQFDPAFGMYIGADDQSGKPIAVHPKDVFSSGAVSGIVPHAHGTKEHAAENAALADAHGPPQGAGPRDTDTETVGEMGQRVANQAAQPSALVQQLQGAQEESRRQQHMNLANQAFRSAATGIPLGNEYAKGEEELAQAPQANLLHNAQVEAQERARQIELAKADPGSPISKKMRDTMSAVSPAFAKQLGPQFDRLTANDVAGLHPALQTHMTKQLESEENARKEAGKVEEAKRHEGWEAEQKALDRASRERAATSGARAQALAYKKEQNTVYGFHSIDPDNPKALLPEQADSLSKSRASRDRVLGLLDELEAQHKAHPHPVPGTSEHADQIAILREMQGSLAGLNNYNLTQGHQHLLEGMIDDPGKFRDWVNSGAIDTQIRRMRKTAHDSIKENARAIGLEEDKTPTKPHPQDEEARKWVREHPNDPQAAEITRLLNG